MDSTFDKIVNDNTSGSAEVLDKLLRYFEKQISAQKSISKEVMLAIRKLGHFAIISFHLRHIKILLKENDFRLIKFYLKSVMKNNRSIYFNIYSSIPRYIIRKNRVFTISNSKTVFEVLKLWQRHNKKLNVIVLESQPINEGKILAKKLNRAGLKTQVIPYNKVSYSLERSDLFLLGCDAILKNGDIINKSGSRDAAIIAKYYTKPVVVVSSNDKQINRNKHFIKDRNKSERFLFEKVERSLITHLITNKLYVS